MQFVGSANNEYKVSLMITLLNRYQILNTWDTLHRTIQEI